MTNEQTIYHCTCVKCSWTWNTKTATKPLRCARCNCKGWNTDDTERTQTDTSLPTQMRAISTADRLEIFALFELCCGMNRGECICDPLDYSNAESVETLDLPNASVRLTEDMPLDVSNHQDKLSALRDLLTQPKAITTEADGVWLDDPDTIENGDILHWHHRPKCKPVCYARESSNDPC